ncbi:cyclin family protein [Nitrosopumilus sp.]|uniref:cyclin family protein n=1 Tax=Nitrosopumilus sp. TaxID=2024843 RepID=UPI003B63A4C1
MLLNYYARLKSDLALSNFVINYAVVIHEKILEIRFGNGRDPFLIALTCIYTASKHSEVPRTLKEVSLVGNFQRKDIARCYRLFLKNRAEIGFVKPPWY